MASPVSNSRERPAQLSIACDGPFGQAPVYMYNELALSGTAEGPATVEDVRVELDGRVYHAARGLPRAGADGAGFELRVNTEGWRSGARHVRVVARDSAGAEAVVDGEVELQSFESPVYSDEEIRPALESGRPAMWCETPWLDGSKPVTAPVRVEGWAWSRAGISGVSVNIDGVTEVAALHGLTRPDLTERLGDEVGASAGFAVTLDEAECSPGWHRLTVVASATDGRNVGISGLVECRPEPKAESAGQPPKVSDTLTADRYVPEVHVGYSFEPEHHARYRWAALLARDQHVLDAGCGTGFGTEILARSGARRVDAFDVSVEAVEHARGRVAGLADVVVGDLHRIPFGDNSFGLATCFEAIEHVNDPQRALDELHRVLLPSGVLLVSTPNRGVYPEGNPHHLHELSSEEFEAAVRGRFRNVRLVRQQTHAASLLAGDETFGVADSSVPLEVQVRKVAGAMPREELYMVAVASDGELPDLPEFAVLGSAVDVAARMREAEAWTQRALSAERALAAQRVQARDSERARRTAEAATHAAEQARTEAEARRRDAAAELDALRRSSPRQLTAPLRAVARRLRR
jgi:SAM-dependent methyltransferase